MNREEQQLVAYEQLAREVEKLVHLVQESQQNQYDFMQEACRLLQEQHEDVSSLITRAGTQDQLQGMLDEVLKQLNTQFQGQMMTPGHLGAGDANKSQKPSGMIPQGGVYQPSGTMPQGGVYQPSGTMPQGGVYQPSGTLPQGGGYQPSGTLPQGGVYQPSGTLPQGGVYQPSGTLPQGGVYQPSGTLPQGGVLYQPSGTIPQGGVLYQPSGTIPQGGVYQPSGTMPLGGVYQPSSSLPQSGVITEAVPMMTGDGDVIPIPLVEQGIPVAELVDIEAVPVVKPATPPVAKARVRFFHASPDTPGVDIVVDGKKVAEDVDFEGISNYFPLTPGRHRVQVFPYGKQVGALIDTTFNAKPNQSYSIVIADYFKNVRPIIIEDEPKKTKPGFARVKFVHLSPNTPAVDVGLVSGKVLIGHLTYKEKSPYLQVAPGRRDLELRLAGKKDVVLRLPKMRFDPNITYTIYIVGLRGGQPPLAIEMIPEA
ncbi:hypothetical protein CIG75_16660 [Tumebacillus algifaecis]|uniref:DUF4397 domain-containing protein n=1 Tax=Tumebacillus algifaecis TaxID=1214604 RepID=A0A223D4P8_9BACL|nr:DUF4397 domain-containing protein [Tumebacillus algifaecis]ASS76427.1 hypothetical protein CIG75_16660 [Tumebacillus algifaecis]